MKLKLKHTKQYLLLIDEKAKLKDGDFHLEDGFIINIFPDHLTDIGECKKILAYLPLNSEATELPLPLLPPIDDVVQLTKEYSKNKSSSDVFREAHEKDFIEGYKAAKAKQFTLDDVKKAIEMARETYWDIDNRGFSSNTEGDWSYKYSEEEIIQSLSTQQSPSDFIPEYIKERKPNTDVNGDDAWIESLKIITNSEGKQEIMGTYKY